MMMPGFAASSANISPKMQLKSVNSVNMIQKFMARSFTTLPADALSGSMILFVIVFSFSCVLNAETLLDVFCVPSRNDNFFPVVQQGEKPAAHVWTQARDSAQVDKAAFGGIYESTAF